MADDPEDILPRTQRITVKTMPVSRLYDPRTVVLPVEVPPGQPIKSSVP
jgi:hypothetical protein